MLNLIVDWSVKNRLIVMLSIVLLTIATFFILPKLNLDAFPDVSNVQVTINTEAQGLASEEVEQLITYPIEAVMYALPDVEEVRSISKTGLSGVTVVFNEGTDIYFARQLVFERLQDAKEQIPMGVGTPEMGPNTSGLGQVYQYMLTTDNPEKFDALALRSMNDWVVKLLLMPVDGITGILSFGGEVRQYQVNVEPQRLLAYGITIDDLATVIEDNNRNAGGWYLDRGAEQLVIRGVGWVRAGDNGLKDIANIPVKSIDGRLVKVSDLAKVEYGGEIRQGAVTITVRDEQGNPKSLGEVVTGIVIKRLGANTKNTIDGVKERIEIVKRALPKGVTITPFYDQAELVEKAVDTVTGALLSAFVFIIIVLMLFLINIRATLLVLISIPLSIGMALLAMVYWNISANLMSLGGLAIAIGMMVDGSVVVMDNIFKRLSSLDSFKDKNLTISQHIQIATKEVASPIFYSVLIIVVVFSPLFSLEGVEGKLFQPMAISVVLALLASLLVALVIVPAVASYFFTGELVEKESVILKPLDRLYQKWLPIAFLKKKMLIGGSVIIFISSMITLPFLGTEFVPELEEGTINVRVTLAPSTSLKTALKLAPILEKSILSFPEALYASSRIGRAELGGDPEPVSNIEIFIGLKPVSEWTSAPNRIELQKLMQAKLDVHPGLLFSFSQPIATRVDELLSGVKAQLAIKLFGSDLDVLAKKGAEIEALTKTIEGTVGVALEQIAGEAQLVVRPDRDLIANFGIPVSKVMDLVEDAIGGRKAGKVIQGNERYDIYVRLNQQSRKNVEAIRDLIIQSATGAWVRLGDIASVKIESGPPQIRRDDVQRRVVIQTNVEGRDLGGLVAELEERIATDIDLPAGYSVVFGGQFENQRRANKRLMIVVPASLGLIFLILYFAFGSVSQGLLIMVNVPLALIGGIFALAISGQYLSVPSSIGFITLFGVAVLNGVVMVNSINQKLLEGLEISKAVIVGATSRLRPVLMTASTSALGLIPLLFATGVGSEIQKPLATVVIGGLVSSTILTLFVLPVLYTTFLNRK
ncbi:MAG: CusA/CzcA family heavy metal efflux RND transporter [Gammaproteobacteria bacterium]|nr:MAG: CusA/CzcA family heavy metal efflux RND transporter [Gammaproteobacteria bacterium]